MAGERFELEKSQSLDLAHRDPIEAQSRYSRSADQYHPDEGGIDIRELWRVVRKRKWMVFTIVVIITTLVAIQMYRAKSIYQASTIVEVGKDNSSLVKAGEVVLQNDDFDPYYNVNI